MKILAYLRSRPVPPPEVVDVDDRAAVALALGLLAPSGSAGR
ncbi:hypothetical protein AB6N24_09015 [Cellulomonas sp. 179-A 4D5 NHS]